MKLHWSPRSPYVRNVILQISKSITGLPLNGPGISGGYRIHVCMQESYKREYVQIQVMDGGKPEFTG